MFENLARAWVDWRIGRKGIEDGADPNYERHIAMLESNMASLQPAKRAEAIEIVKAEANLYHNKRHHEAVPVDVQKRVAKLDVEAKRAAEVDKSEAVLSRYKSVEEALQSFMSEARGEKRSLTISESALRDSEAAGRVWQRGREAGQENAREETKVLRNHTSREEGMSVE